MKTVHLTIRDCPAEVHQAIKASAQKNHRSLRSEVVQWLSRHAGGVAPKISEAQLHTRIKALGRQMRTRLSSVEMNEARLEGRK